MKIFIYLLIAGTSLFGLTDEEKKEGFISLFNGKDLTGWHKDFHKGYTVENGEIKVKGKSNLLSEKEYENYTVRLEYKLSNASNNGLGLRVPLRGDETIGKRKNIPAYNHFEIQILDNSAQKYAKLSDKHKNASAYGLAAAKTGHLKPVGEWNTQETTIIKNHLKIKVNGKLVLDVDLNMVKKGNKYAKGLARMKGHLALCGHGSGVYFRNIRIKELPENYSTLKEPKAPEGFISLTESASKNFKLNDKWSVIGKTIKSKEESSLATSKKYGNFEMYCTIKSNAAKIKIKDTEIELTGTKKDDWNQCHIITIGSKTSIYLNGKLLYNGLNLKPVKTSEIEFHGKKEIEIKDVFLKELPQ